MVDYDIVVIGAGIHGAGVAQAAAAAGYRVCVFEQTSIASGTSSRSSKLIHGGLRYLESFQFGLVRECLRERELLLKLAPDLVKLHAFYLPVYRQTSRSALQIRLGLSVYSLLNGFKSSSRFTCVLKQNWDELDGLMTQDLQKVFRYYDAQTDDKALTEAVIRSAQTMDAQIYEHTQVTEIERHNNGCEVHYQQHDKQAQSCHAHVVINAAGPWVNDVLDRVTPVCNAMKVDLVQGTHIIINQTNHDRFYYLESPKDQRAVFVMPWKNQLLVGTTETQYHGDPARVQPLAEEYDYLLSVLSHYFPRYSNIDLKHIESFAGLRVLPAASDDPFKRSRDTVLLVDNSKRPTILSIYGGKLTAFRLTAEQVMTRLQPILPNRKKIADTHTLMLTPVG